MAKELGKPTCRLCGGMEPTEDKGSFVKYGPSHYAHMLCFIESGKRTTLLRPKQMIELQRWVSKRQRGNP